MEAAARDVADLMKQATAGGGGGSAGGGSRGGAGGAGLLLGGEELLLKVVRFMDDMITVRGRREGRAVEQGAASRLASARLGAFDAV
jgi:hypothetical protein